MTFALAGARIFDGNHVLEGRAIVVENGRIRAVPLEKDLGSGIEIRRIEGLLAPGFIDVQVNGGGGMLFNDVRSVDCLRTIAEAHRALAAPIGYSTVQTRLDRLALKGLARKTSDTPTRYAAAIQPRDVMESELQTLVQRVSGGVVPLVAQLLREHQPSKDELEEIRQLVRQAEARLPKRPKR